MLTRRETRPSTMVTPWSPPASSGPEPAEGAHRAGDADARRRLPLELHRGFLGVEGLLLGFLVAEYGEDRRDHLVGRPIAHARQQEDRHVGAEEEREAALLDPDDCS